MKRSARSRKARAGVGSLLLEGLALTAGAALRNPMAVGGTTAFLVTLTYVSANALWYQPYAHPAAYFATRVTFAPAPVPERFVAPQAPAAIAPPAAQPRPAAEPGDDGASVMVEPEITAALPKGDPQVRLVQDVLKTLDLYTGPVDGLAGPQTAKAVERYQQIVGLAPTGRIDAALMSHLGAGGAAASDAPAREADVLPVAAPVPRPKTGAGQIAAAPQPARAADPMVVRIQAGLKAFGHDAIELDGVVGARTRAAIREFQSLFGLPETGEPDAALFAKMREVGLTE